jgi:hypothetical protein
VTVTPVFNRTVPDQTIPYLTRDQYRCTPNPVDTQNLIRGGSQADQDAELDRLILEASGWCDNAAEQPLTAQLSTEGLRAAVQLDSSFGRVLRLHPRQSPVMAVTGVSFGVDAGHLTTLNDLSSVWVEDQSVIVPLQATLAAGWSGPLQFGGARAGSRVFVSMSYVAGYAVAQLRTAALAGDAVLQVTDATGFVPGQRFRVEQGGEPTGQGSTQTSLVQATPVVLSADTVAGTVTLTAPIGSAFAAGAAVTAMPAEVQQACVYVVTALLKARGSGSLASRGGSSGTVKGGDEPGAEEFDIAEAILAMYRPVVP